MKRTLPSILGIIKEGRGRKERKEKRGRKREEGKERKEKRGRKGEAVD